MLRLVGITLASQVFAHKPNFTIQPKKDVNGWFIAIYPIAVEKFHTTNVNIIAVLKEKSSKLKSDLNNRLVTVNVFRKFCVNQAMSEDCHICLNMK